jgi:hypothetical protein
VHIFDVKDVLTPPPQRIGEEEEMVIYCLDTSGSVSFLNYFLFSFIHFILKTEIEKEKGGKEEREKNRVILL